MTTALRRLFWIVNGGTPTSDESNWGGDIPWATPVDLGRHHAGRITSTDRTLSAAGVSSGSRAVGAGSLIVSTRAPIGYVTETTVPMAFNQGCRGLEPTAELDIRFFRYQLSTLHEQLQSRGQGSTFVELSSDVLAETQVATPLLAEQRAIADYLDAETARIDALIAKKHRMIDLLEERANSSIMSWVGRSQLSSCDEVAAVPIRRVLTKLERWVDGPDEMITAFRDGEVTSRAARGREGFTNSWTENARVQTVETGDVVVHGLDGFSGAIGDAQVDGVCSPVYHVCSPGYGDGTFYGRLLRLLAIDGYLGSFATSTRERAVDFRNWDLFGRIPIPDVPIAEQQRIGDKIRAIRPLRQKILESEALAREHRKALITAAVTGELSIPRHSGDSTKPAQPRHNQAGAVEAGP